MFTGQPLPALPAVVVNADKAEGFIELCKQGALLFGSNRRDPVDLRPVAPLKRDGPRIVVLPCTGKGNPASPDYFELTADRVMWTRTPSDLRSFVFWRYEVVGDASLKGKIGVLNQKARVELLTWAKSRY